ncbi:uncharacterized protein N7482_003114 [Penicillium canariense]|uniref:Uncharacterized protein n=1 Tax=Penicillium canariense TaxID=189055 RepID=A0A9W9IJ15_9EURO|nr:uncharacterized protein N7482_003114 [Penicillium canariense]KAJ5177237.1 hypothetical protein N7482_003114 [Penicillium canariense]
MWRYMEESEKWRIRADKDRKGLNLGEIHRTWDEGFTTFVNVGKGDQVSWFIFTKTDRKFQYPNGPKFTRGTWLAGRDIYGYTHVGAGIKIWSVYENVTTSYVPLRKELASHGLGLISVFGGLRSQGASLAIEDAASLANHIVRMVNSTSGVLSLGDTTAALAKWGTGLRPRAKPSATQGQHLRG